MQRLCKDNLKKQLESTISADVKSGRVGNVAVSVSQDETILYEGFFDDEKMGMHVSEHTLFRMASMTKPITAMAILKLADYGELELDMPVSEFIPEFETMNIGRLCGDQVEILYPAKKKITIRHLLTHSSGLGSGPLGIHIYYTLPPSKRKSLAEVTAYYAKSPLEFEPGSSQCYSGIHGFDVLARVAELAAGESFSSFLEKEIFLPIGMEDTTFSPTEEQLERVVPMHTFEGGIGKRVEFPSGSLFEGIPFTCQCGAAGLASSLSDYKKFAAVLMHNGHTGRQQLISEKMIREMTTPQLSAEIMEGSQRWGLGVRVIVNDQNVLPQGSYGWSGAYGTHFWVDPVNRITAIYLKNSRYDGGDGAKTAREFERDVYRSLVEYRR